MASELFSLALLIEDDPGHALLIQRALKAFVGSVQTVSTFADGLKALEATKPDLIVTDLHLPDTRGMLDIETLRRRSLDVPILVLTASTALRTAVGAMQLGARDFIVKSFDADFQEVLGFSLTRIYATLTLERERRKLRREMEVLRVAIENGSDGLAVTDRLGTIEYANHAFYTFAKLCGGKSRSLQELITDKVRDHSALQTSLAQLLASPAVGAVLKTEVTFTEGAATRAYDLSLSVFGQGSDQSEQETQKFVVWVRDVSELKRREKFQREILSTTSHDLKGPLGAIALSSELITEMTERNNKVHELALRIGSSAQGAINLIDEFLSARRIQEGTFILKPQIYEVSDLMDEVMTSYATIAAAKKIKLDFESRGQLSANVDQLGFKRVIGNLLSNALKFTPRDGQVSVVALEQDGDLKIAISDSGSGMEAAEIQRIFERFSRLERHQDTPGTGLGLFIVKSVVAAHGGKIEVTSQVGKGSTFTVTFPHDPPVNEHGALIALDFN